MAYDPELLQAYDLVQFYDGQSRQHIGRLFKHPQEPDSFLCVAEDGQRWTFKKGVRHKGPEGLERLTAVDAELRLEELRAGGLER